MRVRTKKLILCVVMLLLMPMLSFAAKQVLKPIYRPAVLIAQRPNTLPSFKSVVKRASLGSPYAQYELGQYYEIGRVVKKDFIKAYAYYKLAGYDGLHKAKTALSLLKRKMTPMQIKKGNQLFHQIQNEIIDNAFKITGLTYNPNPDIEISKLKQALPV